MLDVRVMTKEALIFETAHTGLQTARVHTSFDQSISTYLCWLLHSLVNFVSHDSQIAIYSRLNISLLSKTKTRKTNNLKPRKIGISRCFHTHRNLDHKCKCRSCTWHELDWVQFLFCWVWVCNELKMNRIHMIWKCFVPAALGQFLQLCPEHLTRLLQFPDQAVLSTQKSISFSDWKQIKLWLINTANTQTC